MSKPKLRRIPGLIWFYTAPVLMVALYVEVNVWLPYHKEQYAIWKIEKLEGCVGGW